MSETREAPGLPLWRRNRLVGLFCSVKLGITLLTLILLYASIFSALPQVRGALELTEMQAFRHPLFVGMVGLFFINLLTVTLLRIRWSIINAGVLTVHTGLLLLCVGSLMYFGTKVEGDVLLETPRIELFTSGASPRQIGDLPADKGGAWERNMPALGGRVRLEVLETSGQGLAPVQTARLRVTIGDGPAREITLKAGSGNSVEITDRVIARLETFPPQEVFFDDELPALHYRNVNEPESARRIVSLPTLPLHRERYEMEGNAVLNERGGRPARSKRSRPALTIGGVSIPTGWFEYWRMPIAIAAADLPFDVTVTGFVPYVGGWDVSAVAGGPGDGAAMSYQFNPPGKQIEETLFAEDSAHSMGSSLNIEFRWVKTAEELESLARPLAGPHELTIETVNPPTQKTVAVREGEKLIVEGTGYELTIRELLPNWPLMSPGFENARSPVARVDVTGGGKSYNRTVVARFPHLTQDIDEAGMRRKEGPYDPNLKLTYRTATDTGWLIVAAGPNIEPTLIVRQADGVCTAQTVTIGTPSNLRIRGVDMPLTVTGLVPHARRVELPLVEPIDFRRPDRLREDSAVRLTFRGRGEHAGWSESRWCAFRSYPEVPSKGVVEVRPPDGETYEFIYSRFPRPLDTKLAGRRLVVDFFPGRREVTAWRSDFYAEQPDGSVLPKMVKTNVIDSQGRWTFYQASAATDNWSFTILGVGNREGIWPMGIGCILIPLGCLYAFYVKPVLVRRRQAKAIADAARRAEQRGDEDRARRIAALAAVQGKA